MIKKVLIILSVFILQSSYSQDANDNKRNETVVFVLFDGSESLKKESLNEKTNNERISYAFYFPYQGDTMTLVYKTFMDFDDLEAKRQNVHFEVHRSFIKKNKELIYTLEELRLLGKTGRFKLFSGKSIFLIDMSDKRSRHIVVRNVLISSIGSE